MIRFGRIINSSEEINRIYIDEITAQYHWRSPRVFRLTYNMQEIIHQVKSCGNNNTYSQHIMQSIYIYINIFWWSINSTLFQVNRTLPLSRFDSECIRFYMHLQELFSFSRTQGPYFMQSSMEITYIIWTKFRML